MQPSSSEGDVGDESLFDPVILEDCRSDGQTQFPIRPLRVSDYSRHYLQLLAQLTVVGDTDSSAFQRRFEEMQKSKMYFIIVAVDEDSDKIVASTTLYLEYKFIHSNALRARIEDVVVDESVRSKGLGRQVVTTAINLARKLQCYKISLDCRDAMIRYYESFGFTAEPGRANMLVIRSRSE